ncbi:MAG: zinc-ribbon domain-containing protein, partial [Gammaproteobacteria bacterium]|nr:zinc-ribbon domain-containing protein [Gammaproteobacteria bacterium]
MYTKCPNCQTTFRVSTAQLKLAEGKVRCGRCDHVFNAVSHLLDDVPGRSQGVNTSMESASTMAPDLNSLPMAEDMEQALSEVAIPGVDEGLDNVSAAAEEASTELLSEAPVSADDLDVDEDLFSAPAIDEVEGMALGEESFDSEPAPADGLDLDGDLSDLDMAEAPESGDGLELDEDDFNLDGVDELEEDVPEIDDGLDFNESDELLRETS